MARLVLMPHGPCRRCDGGRRHARPRQGRTGFARRRRLDLPAGAIREHQLPNPDGGGKERRGYAVSCGDVPRGTAMSIGAWLQPIAIPDRTIDWTVDLSAVTRSQLERAVRERIGLDHDDFLIRVAVVAFGRKGDVAVDAGVLLELVEIADDLFRFGADILHRFRDQVR